MPPTYDGGPPVVWKWYVVYAIAMALLYVVVTIGGGLVFAMGTRGEEQVQGAKNQILAVGLVVGLLLLIVAFLLGRRGGKRSSAIIEVRRG